MQVLLFYIEKDAYALNTEFIDEILPKIHLRPFPKKGTPIVGIANIHGKALPVIDLTQMINNVPSADALYTRMAVISKSVEQGGQISFVLIVEKAVEVIEIANEAISHPPVKFPSLPFFDGVVYEQNQAIQLLDLDKFVAYLRENLLIENYSESER